MSLCTLESLCTASNSDPPLHSYVTTQTFEHDQGSQVAMPPYQCSCRGPAQLLPWDKDIWRETVKYCTHNPPEKVTKAAGYDAQSNQPIPGFVNLVTNRRPMVPCWLYRLQRGRKALEHDKNYAFCINLADVQRMHLRLLQGRLTWLALSAGFDQDRGANEGVLTELGPTIRDYGKLVTVKPVQNIRSMVMLVGIKPYS